MKKGKDGSSHPKERERTTKVKGPYSPISLHEIRVEAEAAGHAGVGVGDFGLDRKGNAAANGNSLHEVGVASAADNPTELLSAKRRIKKSMQS